MEEIWEDIEGFEWLYQISSLGRVKSLERKIKGKCGSIHTKKEKLRKISKDTGGYLYVPISNEFEKKNYLIHRLVAEAFLPNPENLPQVNHKNEDKTDNNVNNLEWCTREYNNNYSTRNERIAKEHTNNPKRSKKVIRIDTGVVYPSLAEIQRQLGFDKASIQKCCVGKQNTSYNMNWKYVD